MGTAYGRFDDDRREYVVTRPDTPLPWLNYLGQDDLFGLCTNTAGGYTFWRDAKLRRLTRYRYNNVPYDLGGRYLYVRDGETVWNPGWKPTKTPLDRYECRHGLGYTRIVGAKDGVEVELLLFVPPGENVELWRTTVRNHGEQPKDLTLFSFVEFCFYEALNDMSNFQRTYSIGEVEVEGSGIYHTTEYRERRDHYTLFACTSEIAGFDTSRDAFVGVHNGLHEANVPFSGSATGSIAHGWNPIGSHQVDLHLEPGASETFSFLLAYVEQGDLRKFERPGVVDKTRGRAIVERYRHAGCRRQGLRSAAVPVGRAPLRVPGRVPRRGRAADGEHVEPVPVPGHVQPLALSELLRVGDRPRHGLPRLEPGHPRLRAPRARAGAAAHPRPRRHTTRRRHVLSPVPASHQAGKRRDRRRFLRRPPLARAVDLRVHQGDGRHVDPLRAGRIRRHARKRRGPAPSPRDEHRAHALPSWRAPAPADRARRLERLPQPQLLLDGTERVVPDGRRRPGIARGVGHDRRSVPLRLPRLGRALPASRQRGGCRQARRRLWRHACGRGGARVGRRLVSQGLRRLRRTRRLELLRGGADLRREPGLVRARRRGVG